MTVTPSSASVATAAGSDNHVLVLFVVVVSAALSLLLVWCSCLWCTQVDGRRRMTLGRSRLRHDPRHDHTQAARAFQENVTKVLPSAGVATTPLVPQVTPPSVTTNHIGANHQRRAAKQAQARRGSVHLDSDPSDDESIADSRPTASSNPTPPGTRRGRNGRQDPVPTKTLTEAQLAQRLARREQNKRGSSHL